MPKIKNFVCDYIMYFQYHGDYTDTNKIEYTWGSCERFNNITHNSSFVFIQFSFCIFF